MAYIWRMIFIETPIFTKRLPNLLDDDSYAELQQQLASRPDAGDIIEGTGGIRKSGWQLVVVVSGADHGLFIIILRERHKLRC